MEENLIEYLGRDNDETHLDPKWIKEGLGGHDEKPIKWAQGFAKHLAISNSAEDKRDHVMEHGVFKYDKKNRPIFRKELTTNQIRKFFGELKRVQVKDYKNEIDLILEVKLLKPKLAYSVGREKGNNPKIIDFYLEIGRAIDAVENKQQFNNFCLVLESIVAYHKYYESNKKIVENEED